MSRADAGRSRRLELAQEGPEVAVVYLVGDATDGRYWEVLTAARPGMAAARDAVEADLRIALAAAAWSYAIARCSIFRPDLLAFKTLNQTRDVPSFAGMPMTPALCHSLPSTICVKGRPQ